MRAQGVLALLLIAIPAIAFYLILWKNAVRIPIQDDYLVVLGAANWASVHPGLMAKLLYLITAQHNGYKLIFENAIVLGQYSLIGRVRFLPLEAIGNSIALLIFLTVCSMSRIARNSWAQRLMLLTPVAYLIFQMQYATALDWPSSSMQHLAVILFSLLSIYLLSRDSRWSFAVACIALVVAIASSPNGFFVMPVGFLLLLQYRRWQRMGVWVGVTALLLVLYLYRYTHAPSQAIQHGHAGRLTHFSLLYALSFLGSSAARYMSIVPSVTLGLVLCGVFAIAIKRQYHKQNPAVFYSMLFIIVNAVAISGLRSDFGLAQSLVSRYRTYSNIFLALTYIFLIENLLPELKRQSHRCAILVGAATLSVAFCALSDVAGARFLAGRKLALTHNYRVQWKKDLSATNDPAISGNPALVRQMATGVLDIDVPVMQESVRLGVFDPPDAP